jgi:hypothetical protein
MDGADPCTSYAGPAALPRQVPRLTGRANLLPLHKLSRDKKLRPV